MGQWKMWPLLGVMPADSPYLHDRIDVMRDEWGAPKLNIKYNDIPPEMNVHGLKWRPAESGT